LALATCHPHLAGGGQASEHPRTSTSERTRTRSQHQGKMRRTRGTDENGGRPTTTMHSRRTHEWKHDERTAAVLAHGNGYGELERKTARSGGCVCARGDSEAPKPRGGGDGTACGRVQPREVAKQPVPSGSAHRGDGWRQHGRGRGKALRGQVRTHSTTSASEPHERRESTGAAAFPFRALPPAVLPLVLCSVLLCGPARCVRQGQERQARGH
jgi:hypothetical protein